VNGAVNGRVVAHRGGRALLLRVGERDVEVSVAGDAPLPPVGALVRVGGGRVEVVGEPKLGPGESAEWSDESAPRRLAALAERDRLLRALRRFFAEQGFLEVETPTLLAAPGQEPHLLPFATSFHGREGATPLWLATSPEYAMKRLLALGAERIFQLGRSYRDGRDEHSPLHSPEFTLLEWYRAWETLGAIGHDVEALLRASAEALRDSAIVARGGATCDLAAPAAWLSVEQAFRELADVELEPYLDGDDAAFVASLPARVPRVGASPREQADSAYFRLLIERVEPRLGIGRATLLCRHPARHAALAELSADDPRVAERFEAYVLGIELGNAFQELRDADEQERRLLAEQRERVRAGGAPLPISQPFLRALRSGLPPCAGIALGVDRLHLLLAGATRLDEVQPFPFAS
jgi:lysyl-tRNA synthetase class 2